MGIGAETAHWFSFISACIGADKAIQGGTNIRQIYVTLTIYVYIVKGMKTALD